MNFEDLGLGEGVLKAVKECGYETPSAIQQQAIPTILMTRDVVGLAQTGTGKTASFILPMIDILDGGRAKARMPRSLVLEPTRELAAQVAESFDKYGKHHNLNKALLVGGESMAEQKKILDRGVDVLIATPGRLMDLFQQGAVLLNDIKIMVIDEADRMLDMGFVPDIEKIVSYVPPIRQTLLFSATMPPEIKRIADQFLTNPKRIVTAKTSSPAETVQQYLVNTAPPKKKEALYNLIKDEDVKNAFIFCNRKRDVDMLAKWLKQKSCNVAALHGDMAQSERTVTLKQFKDEEIVLLVCSDVAARGLDIAGVSHVFNFDVPMNAEDYIHRIGRTGRAGKSGCSFTIATKHDDKYLAAIEKLIGKKMDEHKAGAQKTPEKTVKKHQAKAPNTSEKENKPQKNNNKKQNQSRNKYKDDDGGDDHGSGFGEHVPAFFGSK
jgi:superfamily II DNA/RNA helicase